MKPLNLVIALLFFSAGCGDDGGTGLDSSLGTDGGAADAGPVDAGPGVDSAQGVDAGGTDAGTPPVGDHVLDASRTFDGALWLAGTVTLPENMSGLSMQINIMGRPDEGFGGSFAGPVGMTDGATVEYAVTGLVDGEYQVQLRVDVNGNGMLGESGDWEGYYDGTVAVPVTELGSAAAVAVRGAPTEGVDFGIGALP